MMRCPTLKELPDLLPGKTGWPWYDESLQLPDTMPDGSPWPKISIVTPSLNQGQFIEETIRSVLLQGYPDLEYIIIDGGSNDGSVEIIKKYEKWLTYWISETDHGQANAINKGFKIATGEVVAWLNSDDFYMPEALSRVSNLFKANTDVDMIYGDLMEIHEETGISREIKAREFSHADQVCWSLIPQPTCFWRSSLINKVGYLDESYHYIFDLEYWIRAGYHAKIKHFSILLACFRVHADAKTQEKNRRSTHEGISMYEKLFSDPHIPHYIKKLKRKVLEYWYERLALKYFEEGYLIEARRSFRRSILLTPWRLQNLTLIIYIIDTFLETDWGKSIQKSSIELRSRIKRFKKVIEGHSFYNS